MRKKILGTGRYAPEIRPHDGDSNPGSNPRKKKKKFMLFIFVYVKTLASDGRHAVVSW